LLLDCKVHLQRMLTVAIYNASVGWKGRPIMR